MRVYLAARFSRRDELRAYAAWLAGIGITVTSRWLLDYHEWIGTDDNELPVAVGSRFASDDLEDIDAADMIVCFTEPPRSGASRGGRHVEFGYALATGKAIMAVGPRENVFYCRPEVQAVAGWTEAQAVLTQRVKEAA